jgi:hypothetical protein
MLKIPSQAGYPYQKGLQVTIFEQLNEVTRSLGGRKKKASRRSIGIELRVMK